METQNYVILLLGKLMQQELPALTEKVDLLIGILPVMVLLLRLFQI